jgi:hypothetical protein
MNPLVAFVIGALFGGFFVSGGNEEKQSSSSRDEATPDT